MRKVYPTPPRPCAILTLTGDLIIALDTPYPLLLQTMERRIPASARRYDRIARHWIIESAFAAVGIGLLRSALPDTAISTPVGAV